jgi:hypothetical protein
MIVEDLEHIFRAQIEQCQASDTKLWFMLEDGEHCVIERHPADDLEGLLPMLDSFQYAGNEANIPRFKK